MGCNHNLPDMRSLLTCLLLTLSMLLQAQEIPGFQGETISFASSDGVQISADLYMTDDRRAPFILLFHQAGYSRGEYRSIAPRLNDLGFNCMAIDQRSGDQVNGVINETNRSARSLNKPVSYLDALPDLESAYLYVQLSIRPVKIILWGSSYSAALAFYLASAHHDNIAGMLAFSPGSYFQVDGKDLSVYASRITCPVFVTSARDEEEQWKPIYLEVRTEKTSFLPEGEGRHGSSALWGDSAENFAYWKAVEAFLNQL